MITLTFPRTIVTSTVLYSGISVQLSKFKHGKYMNFHKQEFAKINTTNNIAMVKTTNTCHILCQVSGNLASMKRDSAVGVFVWALQSSDCRLELQAE